MQDQIFINDVLKIMHSKDAYGNPVKFDIELREFSVQNKTGGKYRVYNEACLLSAKKNINKTNVSYSFFKEKADKNPNHWHNRTRNIELPNGSTKKINLLFIVKFNSKKVIY